MPHLHNVTSALSPEARPDPPQPSTGLTLSRPAMLWVALFLSLSLHARVPIDGKEIGMSLFDAVLAAIFILRVIRRQVTLDRLVVASAVGASLLALAHSAAFLAFSHGVELGGLMRETVKYVGFFIMVGMATLVFADPRLRQIPLWWAGACFLVIWGWVYLQAPLLKHSFHLEFLPAERGVYANVLVGLLVLLILAAETTEARGRWPVVAVAGIGAFALTVLLLAKSLSALVLAIGVATMLRYAGTKLRLRKRPLLFGLIGLGIVVAAAIILVAAATLVTFDVFHLDVDYQLQVLRSGNARVALWSKALGIFAEHPLFGIGLGQFASQPDPVIDDLEMIQLFVHNTPLAMATEMGLLGVILAAGVLVLMIGAIRALPPYTAIAASLYCAVTFLLNDGFGYRAAIIIIGLGLAHRLAALGARGRASAVPAFMGS